MLLKRLLRIYGFNNVPMPGSLRSNLTFTNGIDEKCFSKRCGKSIKTVLGFAEVMTNSISKSSYYSESEAKDLVKLQNNMTAELDCMRSNILYDLLEVAKHNINHKQQKLKVFLNLGTFIITDYSQNKKLILLTTGQTHENHWLEKVKKV